MGVTAAVLTQGQVLAISLTFVALVFLAVLTSYQVMMRQRPPKRRPPKERARPRDVVVTGSAPVTTHPGALLLGAFEAADAGQPVDDLRYTGAAADWGDRSGIIGELDLHLGTSAASVAGGLVLLEEALAQRRRVGPEFWRHELDDLGERRSLPLAERQALTAYAADIERAEATLVERGLLDPGDRIATVASLHWAHGVHLTRIAVHQQRLSPEGAERWFERADTLAQEAFDGEPQLILGSLILPALVGRDHDTSERRIRLAHDVLARFE